MLLLCMPIGFCRFYLEQMMSKRSYYGEQYEGMIIGVMSLIIIVSLLGACSLMNKAKEGCRVSEYTYCGEKEVEHH